MHEICHWVNYVWGILFQREDLIVTHTHAHTHTHMHTHINAQTHI